MQTISYSPIWHERLLAFMREIYPHRDIRYLDWWIMNIDNSVEKCWKKCAIVLDNETIIGCTTVNELEILNETQRIQFYAQANTILLENYRGKGLSRLIYERYNYPEWITFGFTDVAWKIQPKYVMNFFPIHPVNVYISISLIGYITNVFRKLFRKPSVIIFPELFRINRHEFFREVTDIEQLIIPKNGRWTTDGFEIVRDVEYIRKRFVDIFCHERYHIYQYISNGIPEGYIVLRQTIYKGLDMISLVDFRVKIKADETKMLKAAVKVAKMCGIGLVITLTSRRWGNRLFPLTLQTAKKLHSAVGTRNWIENLNNMLITSADSDLDFVYYK